MDRYNDKKDFERVIIHFDMDAYYAQCESKKHNIPDDQPMAVL